MSSEINRIHLWWWELVPGLGSGEGEERERRGGDSDFGNSVT